MSIDYENSLHGKRAMEYFLEGYNCAQSVFLSYAEELGMEKSTALKLSSSFGAGIGRMREVCGAVSGMCMAAGLLYGYDSPKDMQSKSEHYKRIQELAGRFKEENGSIICKELLGLTGDTFSHVPEERTAEYYKKRPCTQKVGMAAAILEEYVKQTEE